MKIAVLSDIHSNLEALTAVLEDIQKQDVQEIYCLGDVLGYGPNPNEVMDLAREFQLTLLGNHDGAVYDNEGIEHFNWIAAMAANWTRKEVEPHSGDGADEAKLENWNRLSQWEPMEIMGRVLFAHGSCEGNREYIFQPKDAPPTFQFMALKGISTCFIGHTHIPCIITEEDGYIPQKAGETYPKIGYGKRMIINVGSVGQPRDRDWRACYVIVDGPELTYRRVEYDVDTTIKKIYEIDSLNNFLGDRLRER